jgi:hypothetical protein
MFIPIGIKSVKFRTTMRVSGYTKRLHESSTHDTPVGPQKRVGNAAIERDVLQKSSSMARELWHLINWSFGHFVIDVTEDYVK